jgi:hypothetical protein
VDRSQQPQAQPTPRTTNTPARSLRDLTVIGSNRPDAEPMTAAEREQWAALEQSFLAQLKQTHANAAARCLHCTRPAVTA